MMTKSHTARVKAEIPRNQRCEYLLGPVGSWFLPHSSDIWSPDTELDNEQPSSPSWFIYGSNKCFCFGRITVHEITTKQYNQDGSSVGPVKRPVALTDHIEHIKNDNSRVICCQFCRKSRTNNPYAVILTESGTLLLYDCSTKTIRLRLNKSTIIQNITQASNQNNSIDGDDDHQDKGHTEPSTKKLKFGQQISCVSWPDKNNLFVSVSMTKERKSYVLWVKIPDKILQQDSDDMDTEADILEFVKLDTSSSFTNIVCMQTMLLNRSSATLIAVGFDDGLINIIRLDEANGSSKKTIDLKRHSDQICGLSFWSPDASGNKHEYSSGLLASVSRDGLVLIWDIENEYYFADYAINSNDSKDNNRRPSSNNSGNWFGLSFIKFGGQRDPNVPYLAVSNPKGTLVNLEIPRKIHASKIRLNGNSRHGFEGDIRHRCIVFNASFDPNHNILMTTSLDNNLIFWTCSLGNDNKGSNKKMSVKVTPSYLMPTMAHNARSHMIRFSPLANDHVAMALGKAGLRFCKLPLERKNSRLHVGPACASACYEVIKQKLTPTSVAWHPHHEYRLTVGTLEGLVLRLDIKDGSFIQSKPTLAQPDDVSGEPFGVEYVPHSDNNAKNGNRQIKTNGIYSLCWGPNPLSPSESNKMAIYSVGSLSHTVEIYISREEDKEKSPGNLVNLVTKMPEKFSNIKEFFTTASEISWKSSLDYMAFGTTEGEIMILRARNENETKYVFEKLVIIKDVFQSNCIQSLAWHPTPYKESGYYYYLAVSSRDIYDVHIFNLSHAIDAEEVKLSRLTLDEDQFVNCARITQSDICLSGHKHSISDISWNPHKENQLCSSSFDGTNAVWQINKHGEEGGQGYKVLSRYVARDRLFTTEWSSMDSDLVLTSGQDSTIIAWRPSKNTIVEVSDQSN